MTLNDILQSCHGVAKKWHAISDAEIETLYRSISEKQRSLTEVKKIVKTLPIIVVENFSSSLNLYYFDCKHLVIFDFFLGFSEICNPDIFPEQFTKDSKIKILQEHQLKALHEHDYSTALLMVPEPFRFYCLSHNPSFPEEEKFRLWIEIYTKVDYGACADELREIIQHSTIPQPNLSQFSSDEIIVFRGEGSSSQSLEKSISWTTDEKIALFFACKGYPGRPKNIFRGRVLKKNVIAYITHRNENEIIAFPENIQDIEKLDISPLDSPKLKNTINNISDLYYFYTSAVLPEWYSQSKGAHDLGHIHRVILFALFMFIKDKDYHYSAIDKAIIMYFAALHDIGRTDDSDDPSHGELSLQKIKDEHIVYFPSDISIKYVNWAKLFIKFHCLPDEDGYAAIRQMSNDAKEFTKMKYLYNVCKDIDALDRFRINDLDPKYLRTKTAHKLIFWASVASREIK